jgi:hypothetical protein
MGWIQEAGHMKTALAVLSSMGALIGAGTFAGPLAREIAEKGRPPGLDAHENHSAVSLLGQARTNVSSWLWVKADLYIHNGVEMRPLTDAEKRLGLQAQTAAADGHENTDTDQEMTVIPAAGQDFRGWFGDVERETTAWKDMSNHRHNDPKGSLPLFRLMTWLDPNFVPGWTMGSTILARDTSPAGTYHAMQFALDGLQQNPDSVEMLAQLGYLSLTRRHDLKVAVAYYDQARLVGRAHLLKLDDDEREALDQSYRWLALCYRNLGDKPAWKKTVGEGLKLFPQDGVLKRQEQAH